MRPGLTCLWQVNGRRHTSFNEWVRLDLDYIDNWSLALDMTTGCRALLFPGEEDFGIVPLEANAAGRPVVAWRGGGALETVREGETGMFFDEPTPESMAEAILAFEQRSWEPACLRRHAEAFDRRLFIDKIRGFLRRTASSRPAQRALEAMYG